MLKCECVLPSWFPTATQITILVVPRIGSETAIKCSLRGLDRQDDRFKSRSR